MTLTEVGLTAEDVAAVTQAVDGVGGTPYGDGFEAYYGELRARAGRLPRRLTDELERFRNGRGQSAGALRVRPLAVPSGLGATPIVPYEEVRDKVVGTEKVLIILAALLGEPIGFADWHQGDRVQNLYPISDLRRVQCASNSVYLEMHTETAFRPDTPTHLALLCLRRDRRGVARTFLCNLEELVDGMEPRARAVLASPRFCFRISEPSGTDRLTEPKPIDGRWRGRRRLHYAEALTGVDQESCEVLAELSRRIREQAVSIELREGDLVLIDNLRMIHGRAAYGPSYDGTDRWLQRVLVQASASH